MSNRIDRSLGPKSFNNKPVIKPIGHQPRWSLKLSTVLKWAFWVLFIAVSIHVLHSTNPCNQGVRCAD